MSKLDVDKIIKKLLSVRISKKGSKPGKTINLKERSITQLC